MPLDPLPGGPFPRTGDLIADLFSECSRHPNACAYQFPYWSDETWCSDCLTEHRERQRCMAVLHGAAQLVEWMEQDPMPEAWMSARPARQVLMEMVEWFKTYGTLRLPPAEGGEEDGRRDGNQTSA